MKRSPADGSGASPPVTSGSKERSGRLCTWDWSSLWTASTFSSFPLYSYNILQQNYWHLHDSTLQILSIYTTVVGDIQSAEKLQRGNFRYYEDLIVQTYCFKIIIPERIIRQCQNESSFYKRIPKQQWSHRTGLYLMVK